LPESIRQLAAELHNNPKKRADLGAIAGVGLDEDLRQAFRDAAQTILLDVLCPTLYRRPVLTVGQLKRLFRQETAAAFLTAVFLTGRNEDAVRRIAEKHLPLFEQKIDTLTRQIHDKEEIEAVLLRDFVEVLCDPEVRQHLTEGLRVLKEAFAVTDAVEAEREAGAGAICATYRHEAIAPQQEDSVERTEPARELILEAVPARVERALQKELGAGQPDVSAEDEDEAGPEAGGAPGVAAATPPVLDAAVNRQIQDPKVQEILQRWRALPDGETVPPAERTKLVQQVVGDILKDEKFVGGLAHDLKAFVKVLNLIYERYCDPAHADKTTFRNKVERLTLINFLLLFRKELRLGQAYSSLFQLLIDLVLQLDGENPDLAKFQAEIPLTLYLDDEDLGPRWVTNLRKTLEGQAITSLRNIVSFVSELRGIKYLMDRVRGDREAEVIVVNATAKEFLDWLTQDNLQADQGRGRLRSGKLVAGAAAGAMPPALVYLTDVAFPDGDKKAWLGKLSEFALREQNFSLILPPLCLSTGPQSETGTSGKPAWVEEGESLKNAAADAPAPVVIVGPSPRLNRAGDSFNTILPAGYLLCAHLLAAPAQALVNPNVNQPSYGRFRVIGGGEAKMADSLNCVLWGEGPADLYRFAVDYYLYLIVTLYATARRRGGTRVPTPEDFAPFFRDFPGIVDRARYLTSADLDKAVLGAKALRFALREDISQVPLQSVACPNREGGPESALTLDVAWFNRAREKAGLWDLPSQAAPASKP
jgi:hypothetical protein